LVGVVTLDDHKVTPDDSVTAGSKYITMGSLRYFLEREVSNGIIEQLEKLDAADGGTARMDAVSWAPGRLVLELIIRTSFLQATAGTRRCISGARQPAAGRCELDLGGPVQHHRLPRGRVEMSGEGDAT
jgi:hypothetical protein